MVKKNCFKFEFTAQWGAGGQEDDPRIITWATEADSFEKAIEKLKIQLACLHENFSRGFRVYFDGQWHEMTIEPTYASCTGQVWREHICMNKVTFKLKD